MARNFFGQRRGMVNPLQALLMQQQEGQQGPPLQRFNPDKLSRMEELLHGPEAVGKPKAPPPPPQEVPSPPPFDLGSAFGDSIGPSNMYEKGEPTRQGKTLFPGLKIPFIDTPERLQQTQASTATRAPLEQALGQEGPAQEGEGQSLFERLDAEKMQPNPSMQGFGAVVPSGVQSAVEETVRQYGVAQSDYQGAMAAMKKEFEDTPEIDEALSNAKQALDQAKMGRKQASAWDFIAIALLNLSGQDPRMSADMVLGLGDQQRTEERLEDQVMGLQGAQIQGRMGGRRDFRQSMLQQQLARAEAEQRAQMEANKERRWQADFGLKKQDQASSLYRALAGQEAETQRFAPESDAGKKAGVSRDLLKKLMQMDDESLQRMLQQRRGPPPDQRQSRMFGRPGGGLA